jgi:hypothetical protein
MRLLERGRPQHVRPPYPPRFLRRNRWRRQRRTFLQHLHTPTVAMLVAFGATLGGMILLALGLRPLAVWLLGW